MMTITIAGATEVERAILRLAAEMPKSIGSALLDEANETMAESQALVPVMTGALKDSKMVGLPTYRGNEIAVEFGYGGAAAKYALAVHENPRSGKTGGWGTGGFVEGAEGESRWEGIQFRWIKGHIVPLNAQRKNWARSGQWKYLEQPVLGRVAGFGERLKARILGGR